DLTNYLEEAGIKVTYMHSDIATMERMEIIRDLRLKKYDVLVGINLLREGLDIPEVSLICILDADKEGFLRSETSLIQTIGRAARNERGKVILYGDQVTRSMQVAIDETSRRRSIQEAYNREHHITPRSVQKTVHDLLSTAVAAEEVGTYLGDGEDKFQDKESFSIQDIKELLLNMDLEMRKAAEELDFERAAIIRDTIRKMKQDYKID
ncbi:MAG: helicase-related protein, partial [Firmicutes bacterium]|nr:helicase-related protein [Bacillota bacterium]